MFPNIRRGSNNFFFLTSACANSGCCPCPCCGGVSYPCGCEGVYVPCCVWLWVWHGEGELIGGTGDESLTLPVPLFFFQLSHFQILKNLSTIKKSRSKW